ncbi:MAG: hypothetical protein NT006_10075 [Candidatus Aminicenantes bacterium]|nr:hypothetical protein [Candidatus Aminicenantes bacterium]
MNSKKTLGFGCLFLFACLASIPAAADETSHKSIKYDFLKCKVDASSLGGFRISHGQGVRLYVYNFNPFLYNIAVNQQTISYNQTIPTLISSALAGSAPAIIQDGSKFTVEDPIVNEKREFQKALSNAYTKLAAAERIVLESIGYSDDLEQEELKGAIIGSLGKLSTERQPTSPDKLKLAFLPLLSEVDSAWEQLNTAYNKISGQANQATKESFELEKGRYLVFQRTDKTTLENALNNAVGAWRALEEAKFETWAGPFFADGDELILKITVTRKAGLDARFPAKRTCSDKPIVRLLTTGGVKVDFSAGFVFAFNNDRVYYLDSENNITRDKKNEAWATVGPGAFIHIHGRQKHPIDFAGTFGVTASKTNAFNYLAGGSILFGKSQRGILTIGLGVQTISMLSGKYREGNSLPEDIVVIPLVNVPRPSLCVGFSYNF